MTIFRNGDRPKTFMTERREQPRHPAGPGFPRGLSGVRGAMKTVTAPRHFDCGIAGAFNSFQMAMPISSRT